eukprot:Selendium_serpulae@DN6331_c4_g1_i4.p2
MRPLCHLTRHQSSAAFAASSTRPIIPPNSVFPSLPVSPQSWLTQPRRHIRGFKGTFPDVQDPVSFHEGSPSRQQWGMGPGSPMMYYVSATNPHWQPEWDADHSTMPRDEFGVPASIPPEVASDIRHVYHLPPQFYPALKKWGDDTPELKPFLDSLMNGQMDKEQFEQMFYSFAQPLGPLCVCLCMCASDSQI